MTSLAITAPPLRRLFQEIDEAARPQSEALAALREQWERGRGDRLFPQPDDAKAWAAQPWAFSLAVQPRRSFAFMDLGVRARAILCAGGADRRESPARRMAVRLRRLAETVVSRGEPLRAWADAAGPSREGVEWLVLPLASDGVRVDAVVGAIALGQPAPSRRGGGGKTPAQTDEPLLFALNASQAFGRSLADALGLALAAHEERDFEDGEHKARPLCDVAGRTAVLVQSLHGDDAQSVNDKLCRMLFFTGALKDAGARRVLLVAPYLCYARKDRRTKLHDPVTTRYLGQLFEAMGADGIATVEVHNQAAFENAFRIPKLHVEQTGALLPYLLRIASGEKLAVVSPDSGGMKRAEALRLALEDATRQPVSKAFMEKQRSMGQVWGDLFAGDVADRTAVIVDDMISTGGSMARTAEECRRRGAARVICAAAHGLFAEGAPALFASPVDRIAVTDTVELPSALRRAPPGNLDVIGVAPTVAASLSPWLG